MNPRKNHNEPQVQVVSADRTQNTIQHKGIWKRFFHTCKVAHIPYPTLIFYFVLQILYSTLIIYVPFVNADFFTGDASVKSILLFLGVELGTTVFSVFELYVGHIFRLKTNRNLRNVLWGKILKLRPSYYDKVSANTLLSRITVDASSLNAFIMDIVLNVISSVYSLVLTILEMSLISLKASFALLAFVPVFLVMAFFIGRLNLKFESAAKFKLANLTEYLSELLASMPIIKAFNRQNYEMRRGRKVVDDNYTAQRNLIGLDVLKQIIGAVVGILPEIAIIVIGIQLLKNSTLTAAGWYVFYVYAGSLIAFVGSMTSLWEQSKSIQGQLLKVSDVLSEEEEGLAPYVHEIVESGDLMADRISFCYEETPILEHASFTIPKNKTTAIIGHSGVGKSTVLKLIERIYEPEEGQLLLSGEPLPDYNLTAWREKLAVVSQNTPMISGTIRENILYGIRREISEEEILEAAKLAKVDAFIRSCPNGLEQEVGQFGTKLSGGQRQKITLARAILMQKDYLILDEPTASLDVLSTGEIAGTLEQLHQKMTIIMVTHQAELVQKADHVIVMNQDRTVQEGTGAEMDLLNEFYHRLMTGEVTENEEM